LCSNARATKGHGDLATNLAMVAARTLKTNPRKLAERVISELQLPPAVVSRTEIADPASSISGWRETSWPARSAGFFPRARPMAVRSRSR
jgi:hypothetical protein